MAYGVRMNVFSGMIMILKMVDILLLTFITFNPTLTAFWPTIIISFNVIQPISELLCSINFKLIVNVLNHFQK